MGMVSEVTLKLVEAGQYGADLFADTATHAGVWRKVEVIVAAVFTTNTAVTNFTADMSATTFPVGTIIRGHFTAIDMSEGTVLAYVSPN